MLKPSDPGKSAEQGSALKKALLVLDYLTQSERPASLADIAKTIDLPRQTIHRILRQLAADQLILRAPQKDHFVVGPALTRLAVRALTSLNSASPVRAVLEMLVDETRETCNVGVLDQDEVVYIERLEGSSPLRLQLQAGSRVPFHCTAIGKLLVAHQHKNVRTRMLNARPLPRFTANTMTDPDALEEAFTAIRSEGYSFNDQEYVDSLTAMAVAIHDAGGKPVAALAVHAPVTRMGKKKALSYLPSMQEKADRIAQAWALTNDAG